MIVGLILGRKGSVGFPGKNTHQVLGRPLAWYPMAAALKSKSVDKLYISTDDPQLMEVGKSVGAEIIERPPELCTSKALGEDAYKHGYEIICRRLGQKPELLVLLFCNAPTVSTEQIDEAIQVLRRNPEYDSAVTVSRYNMWSPLRARRIGQDGCLHPFVPFEVFDSKNLNCDRDSQGDVWFADVALSVIRPENLDHLETGLLPQKWMGRTIYPIKNEAGLDVDFEWQIPQAEWWLRRCGHVEAGS